MTFQNSHGIFPLFATLTERSRSKILCTGLSAETKEVMLYAELLSDCHNNSSDISRIGKRYSLSLPCSLSHSRSLSPSFIVCDYNILSVSIDLFAVIWYLETDLYTTHFTLLELECNLCSSLHVCFTSCTSLFVPPFPSLSLYPMDCLCV